MLNKIFVFTLSILLCASILFAGGREEVESMCTERWGSSQQIRDECIKRQLHAVKIWFKNYFNKYVAIHSDAVDKDPDSTYLLEEASIVYDCANDFKDSAGRYDYELMLECCDEQFRAYNTTKQ